jgi:HPt (histidine-containing phosphotransfer) domain-containing protein
MPTAYVFDTLPCLDIPDALARLGGNKAIFVRLLNTFNKDTNWEQLKGSFSAGDLAAAASNAHAIKGMCGNLSMKALAAAAAELEQSLKAGKADAALVDKLGEVYSATAEAVAAAQKDLV